MGDDFYQDVLIGESVKKTEFSGTWYFMVGDSTKSNHQVKTPDQKVDPVTKEIGRCFRAFLSHRTFRVSQ